MNSGNIRTFGAEIVSEDGASSVILKNTNNGSYIVNMPSVQASGYLKYDGVESSIFENPDAISIIQSNGTVVNGGPFHTINFDANFIITDIGSGVARVSSSSSPSSPIIYQSIANNGTNNLNIDLPGYKMIWISTGTSPAYINTGGFTHADNNREIVIPSNGLYEVYTNVIYTSEGRDTNLKVDIYKNNVDIIGKAASGLINRDGKSGNSTGSSCLRVYVTLNAGDTISVVTHREADIGSVLEISDGCLLSIRLL